MKLVVNNYTNIIFERLNESNLYIIITENLKKNTKKYYLAYIDSQINQDTINELFRGRKLIRVPRYVDEQNLMLLPIEFLKYTIFQLPPNHYLIEEYKDISDKVHETVKEKILDKINQVF